MESLNSSTDSCRIQLRARGQLFMLPVIVTPLAGPRSRHTAITPAQRAREPASSYWNTLYSRASNEGSLVFTITEKPPQIGKVIKSRRFGQHGFLKYLVIVKSSRTFYCRVAASVGSIRSILLEHPVQSPPVLAVLAVSYWNTLYSPTSVGSTSSICVSYLNGALVRPTGAAHCTTDHTDGNDAAVMDATQPPDQALNKVICCSIHSLVPYHLG